MPTVETGHGRGQLCFIEPSPLIPQKAGVGASWLRNHETTCLREWQSWKLSLHGPASGQWDLGFLFTQCSVNNFQIFLTSAQQHTEVGVIILNLFMDEEPEWRGSVTSLRPHSRGVV